MVLTFKPMDGKDRMLVLDGNYRIADVKREEKKRRRELDESLTWLDESQVLSECRPESQKVQIPTP